MMRLALFDLDNTLLAGDSDYEWAQYLIDQGVLALFMTGGTSHVPAVRALFDRRFGAQRIHIGDAFRSVASGLALYALDRHRAEIAA